MPLANITQLEPFNINSSATFSFANTSVTANVSAGNIKTNNLLYANGVAWTFGSTYSNTNVAAYLPTYTGNVAAGNLLTNNLLYANGTAWTFSNYSNTNVAAYLPTYTGNVAAGNLLTNNLLYANGTAWSFSNYSNTNVAAYLPTYTGNINANYHIGNGSTLTNLTGANVTGYVPLANAANTATSATTAGTVTTNAQPNITSVGTLTSLTVSGNLTTGNLITSGTGGNISDANYVIANYFSGNGALLTSITGANVTGYVPLANTANSATTAGTVTTAAQPNITSVGTLTSVTVSGDATITGNLTVSGTYTYANVTSFNVKDPIIEQGGNPNGTPLSSNDGKDRGQLLHYYSSSAIDAFMGWDNSNSEFGFGSNVSVSSEVVTWNSYGNIRAGYIIGNGSTLTSITGANVTGYVATASAANTAATVTTNAQPNITSVGTLTSLTSGLITATSGGIKVGNLQDPSGTNTIQLLNSNISVTGNIVAGAGGSGNVTANFFIGNGSQLTGLPASYSNTNVAAYLPTYTGNVSAGNVLTNNLLYANGTAWSFSNYSNTNVAAYLPTYTGNLSASNLSVTTSANLGAVGNITITGGTSGYVLTTNGSGGLSWAAQSGGGGTGVAVGSVQEFTANGTGNTYTLSTTPSNEDQITVNIDGVLQLHSSYSVSGNVVTLSGTPVSGAKVEITNYNSGGAAGSNTQIQFNDSGNIAGSAALTFNKSSNTLNATNITSNGTPVATTGKAIAMSIVFGG